MIIDKPLNYIRNFKGGVLDNGIKYCIIKDSNIDYSCVACCVGVGSKKDPKEYQGLAHFLEHMLFLGSKKYPGAEYFNEYITQNGGYSNAYTSFFETNYYYQINNNALEKSMDIFSRFFIDPLFDKKFVDREVNAVDSEHSKNINNDFWLIRQIILNLSKEDSVINSFSTGNKETLNKEGVRDEMIKFFNKYYCSNNISIALLTPNDINEMEKLVIDTFSKIKKSVCKRDLEQNMPKYTIKNKEYQLYPVNNTDDCSIVYFCDINYENFYKNNKSIYILSDIINDFNEGGYFHYLKSNGYVHNLYTVVNEEGVLFIILEVNKEKGDLKKVLTEINSITKKLLDDISNYDLNKLYSYHCKKYELNYKFGNKENGVELVQELCVNMLNYPIKNYYNGDKIVLKKDLTAFKNVVKQVSFDNLNILYYYNKDLGVKNKLYDKYYKANYGELKNTLINNKKSNVLFKFIDHNKYYDIKPKIIKKLDKFEIPSLYDKRQWYGSVSRFNEYYVIGKLVLSNSSLFNNIENYTSTIISISVINYYLNLKFSSVMDIGFSASYSSNSSLSNIILSIYGLNDKYTEFFDDVLNAIQNINPTDEIINNYINNTIIKLENIKTQSLVEYFKLVINYMTNNNIYHFTDILKSLKKNDYITLVRKRIKTITTFNNLSLYSIFYGNLNKNNLPNTDKLIKNYNLEKIKIPKVNLIKSKSFKKLNKNDKNNLVVYSYKCCEFNPTEIVKTLVINHLMENESYSYLRTNEQLGYHVGSTIKTINNYSYIIIKVQSEKEVNYIKGKMDKFVEYFKDFFIKKMNKKGELEKIKKSISNIINIESNNTSENFSKYFNEILLNRYFFNKNIILTNRLLSLTKEDMISFCNKIFENKEVITIS